MCLPGSIFVPHQGQLVSWCGEPTAADAPCWLAAVRLLDRLVGIVGRVGRGPPADPQADAERRLAPAVVALLRPCGGSTSQAQIRAVARWNCWSVSSRSVYRISTATPFSPERPATVPCSRRRPSV